ncbi:atypical chemokine receptor 2 isoform X2 [Pipra filicauda]|nr:atypical chemokine receptor 2 isoform X2 [Pipra filicauda]XP_027599137.2 atypical chemokine receptor 2 isoform X2 [Pipra filicauda]XP_027599138.2 atypical chemokine receptor 2 isoform X2 [Pipra filicauda]
MSQSDFLENMQISTTRSQHVLRQGGDCLSTAVILDQHQERQKQNQGGYISCPLALAQVKEVPKSLIRAFSRMETGEETPLPGTAWNGYLSNFRHGTTAGSHLSNTTSAVTTITAPWLAGANSSEYPYEYLDEEDYGQYGLCTKEEVLSFSKVFLPSFYTVVFLLGMAGNALLFIVLIMYIRKRKKMTEVYLLNLVVSDFFLLLTLPFWALYVSQGVTWDILCPVLNAMYTLNFYSGIFFVSCMSLDMYLQIVYACSAHSSTSWRKSILGLLVVWILSILLSIPDGLFTSTRQIHNKTTMCTQDYGQDHLFWKVVFQVTQNILGFLLPFLFMVFCYSRIVCVLSTSQLPGSRRALCLVFTLVGVFFVLWSPYNIVLILHSLQDVGVIRSCESSRKLDYAMQVTESLSFVHCCLNPLLYAFVKKRFRSYLWKIPQAIFRRSGFFHIQPSETSPSCSRYVAEIEMLSVTTVS